MKIKLIFILIPYLVFSQGYTSYFTGNTTNITTTTNFGVCLMGGATENDNAMKWLLQKANGGDVVVLRSTGSNGYNNYLYSGLGIPVNSVETLVITSAAGAVNPYVLNKVANAEMIWFAGGDQFNYVSYFKDNALEDAINNHINVKNAPIGGTSAGMAILGQNYFSAQNGSVTSVQATSNPFHPNITLGINDFIDIPILNNVITDTHFDNPDRRGRLMTFLGRLKAISTSNVYGIASNEYVAVCIDGLGNTQVFGEYPAYQEFAYFVVPLCVSNNLPETMQNNLPLTWSFNGGAVSTYKVAGLPNGSSVFNLNSLFIEGIGQGGEWKNWTVNNGIFNEVNGNQAISCLLNNENFEDNDVRIFPNPTNNTIKIEGKIIDKIEVYSILGKEILTISNANSINVSNFENGIYILKIHFEGMQIIKKMVKN